MSQTERFAVKADGTKISETDFHKLALDKYCQHYIIDHELQISDIFKKVCDQCNKQSTCDITFAIAQQVYAHKNLPGLSNDEIMYEFLNMIYESEAVMRTVLSVPEFRIWQTFRRR